MLYHIVLLWIYSVKSFTFETRLFVSSLFPIMSSKSYMEEVARTNKQKRLTVILSIWCVMVPGRSLNVKPGVLMLWNGTHGNITHVLCSLRNLNRYLVT